LYPPWNTGSGQVHIALLGDPTLRMHWVRPATGLNASADSSGVHLNWGPSPDSVIGYHVFRASTPGGPYTRVTAAPVTASSFTDSPLAGNYSYMVRAVKLEQTPSGTYFNMSQGIFASTSSSGSIQPPPIQPPPQTQATAHFVEMDSSTTGNWPYRFGAAGYAIANKANSLSGFSAPANIWEWADNTGDGRALLTAPSASTRVAAAWFGDNVVCTLGLSDAKRIAFYFVDWDRAGRAEIVSISDAVSGAVLDSRQISGFTQGTYLAYDISGQVKVTVSKQSGPNAVLSGVFAGSAATTPIISDRPLQLNLVMASSGAVLRVTGDLGEKFRVYTSSDLLNWSELSSSALQSSSIDLPLNIDPGQNQRYFRTLNYH
jgi:hypothetical protein